MVPAIRVLMWVLSPSLSFAKPKSDILALKDLSSNTLLVLMSLCTIFSLDSSWRQTKPLAIPIQILHLVGQSNFNLLVASRPTYHHNNSFRYLQITRQTYLVIQAEMFLKVGNAKLTKKSTGKTIIFHILIYQQQLVAFNTASIKLYKIWMLQCRNHAYFINKFTASLLRF